MIPPHPDIHSMREWNDTDVVLQQTKRTKTVSITIDAKTTWTANRHPGGGGHYDARGWQGHPGHYHQGYKCPGLNEGCQVGKIAHGGVMVIFAFDSPNVRVSAGRIQLTLDVPSDQSGSVLLGINDALGGIGDNDGILQVLDITVTERPR